MDFLSEPDYTISLKNQILTAPNMNSAKFLYCIIKEKEFKRFEIKGINGKEVYTIPYDGLAAVVSDSEIKKYFITRENLLTYQKVLEETLKEYDVLPIKFGTVAQSGEEIKERLLKSRSKEFQRLLAKIEGKIEFNLKAMWQDISGIFQEIVKENAEIQELKRAAQKKPVRQIEAITIGRMVAQVLEKKKEQEAEFILRNFQPLVEDIKENKLLGDQMILNAAFLVKRPKEKEFDRVINKLGNKYESRIKLIYVGPLPAFNFVELRM